MLLVLGVAACGDGAPKATAEPWPEADALFHGDPTWVGGDGAYSVDLGAGRVLWSFGDSLIARGATRTRDGAYFIRNSVAVQTGYDPSRAVMAFYWADNDHSPGSFFPEQGAEWFWPSQGVMLGGSASRVWRSPRRCPEARACLVWRDDPT